jgi:ketosteroid isomerase-like protein
MSQENVEVVRSYFKVWNAGDMESVRELYDPDAVMVVEADWPEAGPFIGREAVMEQLNQARGAFDSDTGEILSDPLAAGDRVIVRTAWHGVGSGPESDMEWTNVFTVRDGRIFKAEYFWNHDDALESAGLLG